MAFAEGLSECGAPDVAAEPRPQRDGLAAAWHDVTVGLRVADEDTQTSFIPIWVGYPKSERFEAQFRLIENDEIRQLTSTGPMKGSAYRYACNREVRAV